MTTLLGSYESKKWVVHRLLFEKALFGCLLEMQLLVTKETGN